MTGLKLSRLPLPLVKQCHCSTDIKRQIEPGKHKEELKPIKPAVVRVLVLLVCSEENTGI